MAADFLPCARHNPGTERLLAYSGEVDRPFRRNVTGDSAESALWLFSTRIGHVQSRFLDETRFAASTAEAQDWRT